MGNLCGNIGRYVHKCELSGKADVISQYIHEKYYLRKFFRTLCLISRDESHRKTYRTSSVGIRKADYFQLKNYYYHIHPFSPFRYYWEVFMILVYLAILISVPIVMVLTPDDPSILFAIFAFQIITTANIIVQFFSGYFDKSTNVIIFNQYQIFKNYFWQLILDVLATLPISFFLYFGNLDVPTCHYANYLLLLNSYSLIKYSSAIINKTELNVTLSRLIQWSVSYFIIVLWFSTFLNADQSVINQKHILATETPKDSSIGDIIFWWFNLLSVLFGLKITYSAYFGVVMLKHMLMIVISFLSRIIILAHIILLFKSSYSSSRKYSSLFKELTEFIHYKKLPAAIKDRIFTYYKFKVKRKFYTLSDVWKFLPDHYKFELNKHWSQMWFQSELFRNCSVPVVHLILKNLVNDVYLSNDVIFKFGTVVNHIYFLKTGTVAFLDEDGHELYHVDEGNFFSDTALILAEVLTHEFTAVAVETCEVYKLNRADFRDIITLYPEEYKVIMHKFNKRNQRARFSLNKDDVKAYLDLLSKNK